MRCQGDDKLAAAGIAPQRDSCSIVVPGPGEIVGKAQSRKVRADPRDIDIGGARPPTARSADSTACRNRVRRFSPPRNDDAPVAVESDILQLVVAAAAAEKCRRHQTGAVVVEDGDEAILAGGVKPIERIGRERQIHRVGISDNDRPASGSKRYRVRCIMPAPSEQSRVTELSSIGAQPEQECILGKLSTMIPLVRPLGCRKILGDRLPRHHRFTIAVDDKIGAVVAERAADECREKKLAAIRAHSCDEQIAGASIDAQAPVVCPLGRREAHAAGCPCRRH